MRQWTRRVPSQATFLVYISSTLPVTPRPRPAGGNTCARPPELRDNIKRWQASESTCASLFSARGLPLLGVSDAGRMWIIISCDTFLFWDVKCDGFPPPFILDIRRWGSSELIPDTVGTVFFIFYFFLCRKDTAQEQQKSNKKNAH